MDGSLQFEAKFPRLPIYYALVDIAKMQEFLVSLVQKSRIQVLDRISNIPLVQAIPAPIFPNKIETESDGNTKGDSKAYQHGEKPRWV
jgi:hypothetical protein